MDMGGNNIQFMMGIYINGNGNVNNISNKGIFMNYIVDINQNVIVFQFFGVLSIMVLYMKVWMDGIWFQE